MVHFWSPKLASDSSKSTKEDGDGSTPSKEGWLFKEGRHNAISKQWQQRWFVLDEGHLRYFYKPDDLEPIQTIHMSNSELATCKRPRVGKYAFRINALTQADRERKYILASETAADAID